MQKPRQHKKKDKPPTSLSLVTSGMSFRLNLWIHTTIESGPLFTDCLFADLHHD